MLFSEIGCNFGLKQNIDNNNLLSYDNYLNFLIS